jgi:hypothetical protein
MKGISNLEIKPVRIDVTVEDRRTTATSSKGNQTKWCKNETQQWVKVDFMGYEGIVECFSSFIAHNTNMGGFAPVVDYFPCSGTAEGQPYVGCYSNNFLAPGESCVTVQRLINFKSGKTFNKQMERMSTKNRIKTVVDFIKEETDIKNFGEWFTCLMEFDSFILNEDRHLHNIAVIRKADDTYKLMPLFDNGAAFCSDTTKDYPLSMPIHVCKQRVKAKPFNTDFNKQVAACRELYGRQLKIDLNNDIPNNFLDGFLNYSQMVKARIMGILRLQLTAWK